MNPNTPSIEDSKTNDPVDPSLPKETDDEEFQVTVKKLELPVKPRGVLAE